MDGRLPWESPLCADAADRFATVVARFSAIPPPPPPPPPPLQVVNFSACPSSDTHPTGAVATNGQPVPACNRDWSGSSFASGNEVFCTGEVLYGTGRVIQLRLVHDDVLLISTEEVRIDSDHWYFFLHYIWNPSIPSGGYVCQIRLDGSIAVERPFSITQ